MTYLVAPPPVVSLPAVGHVGPFPVRRGGCVGQIAVTLV